MVKESGSSEDGKITIKKKPYNFMLTHALKYGNDMLEINEKVLGICLGKVDEKKKEVSIEVAIPITHGQEVNKEFSQEILSMFSEVDNKYPELSIQGWYTSCTGDFFDFSSFDIQNQKIFQTKKTPYGFCIVFNHFLMRKKVNLGFEIYRLNDYKKKEYHRVPYELEIPSTLNYFKWVKELVEDGQKNNPTFIKEYADIQSSIPQDLQAIPTAPEDLLWDRDLEELNPIISGFKEGTEKFTNGFLNDYKYQLGNWTNDLNQSVIKNVDFTQESINRTKEVILGGMTRVQNWFEKNLIELVDNYKNNISGHLTRRINRQNELGSDFSNNKKDEIINSLTTLVNNGFNNIVKNIEKEAKSTMDNLNGTSQVSLKLEEFTTTNSRNIVTISNVTNSYSNKITEKIGKIDSSTEQIITNELEKFNLKLNSIKESNSKMDKMLQELQDLV